MKITKKTTVDELRAWCEEHQVELRVCPDRGTYRAMLRAVGTEGPVVTAHHPEIAEAVQRAARSWEEHAATREQLDALARWLGGLGEGAEHPLAAHPAAMATLASVGTWARTAAEDVPHLTDSFRGLLHGLREATRAGVGADVGECDQCGARELQLITEGSITYDVLAARGNVLVADSTSYHDDITSSLDGRWLRCRSCGHEMDLSTEVEIDWALGHEEGRGYDA